jgi:hypothetical protein
MMLAERGADLIKGTIEPSISAAVYIDEQWQTRQRERVTV